MPIVPSPCHSECFAIVPACASQAGNGALLTVRLLLKAGADPSLVDSDGRTARDAAARLADSLAAAASKEDGDKREGAGVREGGPDAATVDQILDLLELFELVRTAAADTRPRATVRFSLLSAPHIPPRSSG
jgi:hypothetical protein